jgi:hypothetical protein
MENGLDRLHLDPGARELETARADPRHQPADDRPQQIRHTSQGQATRGPLDVLPKAVYRRGTAAGSTRRSGPNFGAEQVEQFLASFIAYQ